MTFSWSRFGGYECSGRGDARFSAFNAILEDGRSIEEHYQCDVKGYDPGGRDWRKGKGRPPLHPVDLWDAYLNLWRRWVVTHESALTDLADRSRRQTGGLLSDRFATTDVNQAHALAVILNERGL